MSPGDYTKIIEIASINNLVFNLPPKNGPKGTIEKLGTGELESASSKNYPFDSIDKWNPTLISERLGAGPDKGKKTNSQNLTDAEG